MICSTGSHAGIVSVFPRIALLLILLTIVSMMATFLSAVASISDLSSPTIGSAWIFFCKIKSRDWKIIIFYYLQPVFSQPLELPAWKLGKPSLLRSLKLTWQNVENIQLFMAQIVSLQLMFFNCIAIALFQSCSKNLFISTNFPFDWLKILFLRLKKYSSDMIKTLYCLP